MSELSGRLEWKTIRVYALIFFLSLIFFFIFEWEAFSRSHLWLDELCALGWRSCYNLSSGLL